MLLNATADVFNNFKLLPVVPGRQWGENLSMTKKELLRTHLPMFLSSLRAEPNSRYNHIYATPNNKTKKTQIPTRSEDIGLAQFYIQFNEEASKDYYTAQNSTIRVEENYYNFELTIFAKKRPSLKKSDFLVFGDEYQFFVSDDNSWLEDKKYFYEKTLNFGFGLVTAYIYNVHTLLGDKRVYSLSYDKASNEVIMFTGKDYDDESSRQHFNYFEDGYDNVLKELENIYIQSDPRVATSIYYCYSGQRYTNQVGTAQAISNFLSKLSGEKPETLYQRVLRAKRNTCEKGVAHCVEIKLLPAKERALLSDINFDGTMIVNHHIAVYVSLDPSFDVIENRKINKTENMTEYLKLNAGKYAGKYNLKNKVRNYLKRHNNELNPKWNDEEKEIAKELLNK